jgi:hypothetical protein
MPQGPTKESIETTDPDFKKAELYLPVKMSVIRTKSSIIIFKAYKIKEATRSREGFLLRVDKEIA